LPFIAALRKRNNVVPVGLMSDHARFSASRSIKRNFVILKSDQQKVIRRKSMSIFIKTISPVCLCLSASLVAAQPAHAQSANTTFFVTSNGIGNGANLGGLAGADNYCQTLAQAAGAGAKTWHAYLSAQAADGKPAVNARDRIGKGPWQNSKGVVIAKDVAELHAANNLTKQTALASGCATTMRRNPGIVRIPRADRMAAARRPISRAPAVTACCTVSRRTRARSVRIEPRYQESIRVRNNERGRPYPAASVYTQT
jgi:hypothetical protein